MDGSYDDVVVDDDGHVCDTYNEMIIIKMI